MFRSAFLALIRFYRKGISPWTPPSCRFTPTCSAYAYEAIERFGAWRGGWMAVKRILRCHPFGGHGWDPVPSHGVGGGKEGGEDDPSERPSPAPISESERKTGTDEA